MDLNSHPCSFLNAHLNCVSKSYDDKLCYEEASVFLLNMVPRYGIDDGVIAGCLFNARTILLALQGYLAMTLQAPYNYRKSLQSFLGLKCQS